MCRRSEFKKPPPEGWTPAVGDTVFVNYWTPHTVAGRARVDAVLAPDVCRVSWVKNGKRIERTFLLADLRPVPNA
jgi:hypothetical protein